MLKKWLSLCCSLLLPLLVMAQKNNTGSGTEPYAAQWQKIDSLIDGGLPRSAVPMLTGIYAQARNKDQAVQMVKAQLYLMRVAEATIENADSVVIGRVEQEIHTSAFPVKAIWQSIGAQLYWNYYRQHRWQLLDRTRTEEAGPDFQQWDASRFVERASELYRASLSQATELKGINIATYDPILVSGVNTRACRPTLYDLLAFRALSFFENDEKDLTQPAFRFVMDDPAVFDPAPEFAAHRFSSKDSSSLQWLALGIYQQLLRLHASDAQPDALLDADLQRLEFVNRFFVGPGKKDGYRKALEHIGKTYAGHPFSALASYRLALLMDDNDNSMPEDPDDGPPVKRVDHQYPQIREKMDAIVRKYPNSEGGAAAQQYLHSLLSQELSLQAEEAVLPAEASKVLLRYRNVNKVYVRVAKVDVAQYRMTGHLGSKECSDALLKATPLHSFAVDLPGTQDYDRHSTELKIDALPVGSYAVLVSSRADFPATESMLAYVLFQSTGLAVVTKSDDPYGPSGFVLDRKTGSPVAGASLVFYDQQYDRKTQQYGLRQEQHVLSQQDGSFQVEDGQPSFEGLVVRKGNDVFYNFSYLHFSSDRQEQEQNVVKTVFFTDRSIYRPGQTIYFKGIMLQSRNNGSSNEVLPGRETDVVLYDVNDQKIASLRLKTNEYGSFSGSFTAPENGLTGEMRLDNGSGQTGLSVEEYKRPKFFVAFDTVKGIYALNEKVILKGKATAYAGNAIDGATVQYRVVRNARFPFWWCYWRYGGTVSPEQELASGTVVTDADGSFAVAFSTLPDPAIDERSLPVFCYTVSADVTDVNGETRSGSQRLNAGYRSLQFSTVLPETALPEELNTLNITTQNLNDVFTAAQVHIRIARLQQPDRVYRKRLWPHPDQQVMSEAEFRRAFPMDEYADESNHLNWPQGAPTWEKSITTTADAHVPVPASAFAESGWYVVSLDARDRNGQPVQDKKYVQVWNRAHKSSIREPLLVLADKSRAEPGERVRVSAATGYEQAHVLQQVFLMDNTRNIRSAEIGREPLVWQKEIAESDRGGLGLSYLMVKENRVYTADVNVEVPWSNKELDISWETHRDKLLPGQQETWTMTVKGSRKEKVAAEMVATLYDASLDAFRPHDWLMGSLFPSLSPGGEWDKEAGFGTAYGNILSVTSSESVPAYEKSYDELMVPAGVYLYTRRYKVAMAAPALSDAMSPRQESLKEVVVKMDSGRGFANATQPENPPGTIAPQEAASTFVPRRNLRETAFFYPELRTDAEGNIHVRFTIPEALTEWKFLALAHTKDMSSGYLSGRVKTQKDLMVVPGLPRFFRQGDDLSLSTKISNLSNEKLQGMAKLELLDAQTLQPLSLPFRLQTTEVPFSVTAGQSTSASWTIHVPGNLYEPVVVRISARAGHFTDGEENTLPVVTNRVLVTETMPLWINGDGSKEFRWGKLLNAAGSPTLAQQALTVEYTESPAWYAVQALPYLMEYPYECAEQTFNRYYAHALAAHIVGHAPRILEIFSQWQQLDTAALMSNLQKNQELKSALLEETPWVLDAQDEPEQKKRMALLFESAKLARNLSASSRQLEDMQLPEGGFPWFKGSSYPDRYITQYIVTGIGRLQHLGIRNGDDAINRITGRALPYLDKKMEEDYDELLKSKARLDEQHIGNFEVQYLYMRSFFADKPVGQEAQKALAYYQQQVRQYWPRFNPYMKGMMALALQRYGDKATPVQILQSLKETAQQQAETGMYWMQPGSSYWWYEAPVEAQSLLIECFSEVAGDQASVDAMRVWLLKQKQTQGWATTKATADASYALLLGGSQWLDREPQITIQLGNETIRSTEQKGEAGTGYFRVRYGAQQVQPEMGHVKLSVQGSGQAPSWGAVYWQYFEEMDKISTAATPLALRKQLFIERNGDRGPVLEPITEQNVLKVGDKVKVRIELTADRDMEYVHLKDMRGACFVPVNVLSGYRWQGDLGYYESTKDLSSSFFIDHLRKGKYVFEYPVFVTHKGTFSNGIATIQCMYAPEFSAHSEGMRVQVQ